MENSLHDPLTIRSRSARPYRPKCTPGAVAERILDLDKITFDSRDRARAPPVPDDQLIEK
jgi:hypothetical protein